MASNVEELQRSVSFFRGLVEVSALINSITHYHELLTAILDVAQRVMGAEASSLFLINEASDALELTIARGPSSAAFAEPIPIPRGRGVAGWVRESGQSALVTDAYQDDRFYPDLDRSSGFITRSILCIPLRQNSSLIGVLQVLNPTNKDAFDQLDLDAFAAYGNLVATAITKVRAIEQERLQLQLERDLALATEIQQSFLPTVLPILPELTLAVHYRPAHSIAGDFYDVIRQSDDEICFVIGDVAGKGIPAALVMVQALNTLRLILRAGVSSAESLRDWNARLHGRTVRGMFVTAAFGRVFPRSGEVEFALAGHAPPLLQKHSKQVIELQADAGPPLGVLAKSEFLINKIKLLPGEQALFYTDGLIESFDVMRRPFSKPQVQDVLSRAFPSSAALIDALVKEESRHRGEMPPHDDLTLLALGRK